ncbi:hypothetical protein [Mycobacterium sp. MMS18-G62]
MAERDDVLKNPAVTAAVGAASLAASGVAATYGAVTKLPLIGPQIRRGVTALSDHGERVIEHGLHPMRATITDAVVRMVDEVLAELDLIGWANKVIEGVDLQAIIREATDSVTTEVVTEVWTETQRADDLVTEIVDEVLGRHREDH